MTQSATNDNLLSLFSHRNTS